MSQFIKGVKLLGFKSYKEKTFRVEEWSLKKPTDKTMYSGYWQSETYFEAAADELRKDFEFKGELSVQAKKIQEKIESVNAVCVHIRRGDYETQNLKFKEDLRLMATCKHFIMSASSFSWWAVWLSHKKENTVIAPKIWFFDNSRDTTDLTSEDWVRL